MVLRLTLLTLKLHTRNAVLRDNDETITTVDQGTTQTHRHAMTKHVTGGGKQIANGRGFHGCWRVTLKRARGEDSDKAPVPPSGHG